jgi:hypothetical protein
MPVLSVWAIRAALIYFLAGITAGSLMLMGKALMTGTVVWAWLPFHIESLMLGFVLQLTMGVAYWILPRLKTPKDRGNRAVACAAFAALNAGILAGSFWPFLDGLSWFPALARGLELIGVFLFVIHAWPRIYPYGKY